MAARVCKYGAPIPPLGKDVVVMVKAEDVIVRNSVAEAFCAGMLESVTWRTSLRFETGTVGVPLINPLEGFKVNPAGRAPKVIDQLKGVVPPAAASVDE